MGALTRVVAVCLACLVLVACDGPRGEAERTEAAASVSTTLYVDPANYDFGGNPELLERILETPHGYFRFINIPFSQRVCDLFADRLASLSSEEVRAFQLNLHGDAHLEQYAVTELGRGLTDFDDSSQGPPFLDLMRFVVSLRLASRANGWDQLTEEGLVRTFLDAYRSALADPTIKSPEPSVAARLRESFGRDTTVYLEWAESLMEPVPAEVESELRTALVGFGDVMAREHPEVRRDYFTPVRVGYLKLGVGSALDTKFLVRVRGPSDDPGDDDVIEVKHVRDLTGISCIQTPDDDPLRVLLSQARISYEPFHWLGYVRLRQGNFWTHGWVRHYAELDVDRSFRTPEELAEVAQDVGVQLGIGHAKLAAAPFDLLIRRQVLRQLDAHPGELERLSSELTQDLVASWSRFVSTVRGSGDPVVGLGGNS